MRALIGALAGDETAWMPAYRKLLYFDPRLALSAREALAAAPNEEQRLRLVAAMMDVDPPATLPEGVSFELREIGGRDVLIDSRGGTHTFALTLSELEQPDGRSMSKQEWRRAIRAIVLLGNIGTPEAMAIVGAMATGNEEASPTQVAKEELAMRGGRGR
jgi:hypothetical protein